MKANLPDVFAEAAVLDQFRRRSINVLVTSKRLKIRTADSGAAAVAAGRGYRHRGGEAVIRNFKRAFFFEQFGSGFALDVILIWMEHEVCIKCHIERSFLVSLFVVENGPII